MTVSDAVAFPQLPKGSQIFDEIMVQINPELTTEGRTRLVEAYKNETHEETVTRAQRYEADLREYERRYHEFLFGKKREVSVFVKTIVGNAEVQDRQKETDRILTPLEQTFASLPSEHAR